MVRVVMENLVVRREGLTTLDGLTMNVPPRTLTLALGPSGAGKTMLARILAGLEPLDEGEIYLDGRAIHRLKPDQRRVGLLLATDSLWHHLSVAQNVAFGPRIRKTSRRERRRLVVEALSLVGIESLAGLRPDQLTPPQRVRAELARALALEPELIVADDPFGRLEPADRLPFMEDLRRVQREAEITVLATSREAGEVWSLADQVGIIDLGRVAQVGTAEDLYNHPSDPFVAQFLGPVNLFQGHVEEVQADGLVLVKTPLGPILGHGEGNRGEPFASGMPVTVAIRPEAIDFDAGSAGNGRSNRLAVAVEDQTFLGPERRLALRGPGGWPLTARLPQHRAASLKEGASATVAIPPERVSVLLTRPAARG